MVNTVYLKIIHTMVPNFLYKYRSVSSDQDLNRVLDTMINGTIFFGSSFSFNDLFDCRPIVQWACSDEQFLYHSLKLMKKQKKQPGRILDEAASRKKLLSRIGTNDDPRSEAGRKKSQRMIAEALSGIGVFCAATRPDNLLMWSHYADGGGGVCFELATLQNPNWQAVEYLSERVKINLAVGLPPTGDLKKSMLVKSEHWRYEDEWRLFGTAGAQQFPEKTLTRIIFGPSCKDKVRKKILNAIIDNKLDIKLANAKESVDAFQFDIVPFDISDDTD